MPDITLGINRDERHNGGWDTATVRKITRTRTITIETGGEQVLSTEEAHMLARALVDATEDYDITITPKQ